MLNKLVLAVLLMPLICLPAPLLAEQATVSSSHGNSRYGAFYGTSFTVTKENGSKASQEQAMGSETGSIDPDFRYELTKGAGIDVCEAYLKRLNTTQFDLPPLCDRPENVNIEGFEKLNRVELTAEELYLLYFRMSSFLYNRDQFYWERQTGYPPKRSKGDSRNREREIEEMKRNIRSLSAWAYRYNPPIDFDNDGIADDTVVVFKNSPTRCGNIQPNSAYPERGTTVVFILSPDHLCVDETMTERLIGHPAGGYPLPNKKGFYRKFRPVGLSMGIFRYKNVTYFDTYFDSWGDLKGKRRNDPNISEILGVFMLKRGKMEQVCEYVERDYDERYMHIKQEKDIKKERKNDH